jgi:hypothetical protein
MDNPNGRPKAENKTIIFTSDVDWASDYIIGKELELFNDAGLPVFLFLTHHSPLLETLGREQVGAHPYISAGSSQAAGAGEGAGDQEIVDRVFDYLGDCVPGATAFRCHRYQSSNDINDTAYRRGYRYSSNTCTRQVLLPPFLHRSGLLDFPVFFEDGGFMWLNRLDDYTSSGVRRGTFREWFSDDGIYIINVHPMHMAVNTPHFSYMREIKDRLSREEYARFGEAELSKVRSGGFGIADFVADMIDYIIGQGILVGEFMREAERIGAETGKEHDR